MLLSETIISVLDVSHNYQASSGSGTPCFCRWCHKADLQQPFSPLWAHYTQWCHLLSRHPPLHLTLSYNAQSCCPISLLAHIQKSEHIEACSIKYLSCLISCLALISPPLVPLHGSITHSGVICCPDTHPPPPLLHLLPYLMLAPQISQCTLLLKLKFCSLRFLAAPDVWFAFLAVLQQSSTYIAPRQIFLVLI